MSDAIRRRLRLRRLLASVQSSVRSDNVARRRWGPTAAAVTLTTVDNNDGGAAGGGGGPFVSRDAAMTFTSMRRRDRRSLRRRGVVCECCVHRCQLDELQGYCGSATNSDGD